MMKKNNIKKYTAQIIIPTIITFTPTFVSAVEKFKPPIKAKNIQDLIAVLLDLIVNIGAIITVFFLIYAGFLFVMAQGNPEGLTKAKKTFIGTIIGATILLGAKVISEVIQATVEQF